ncbi:long-chain fatty acid transport protein, outer membrane protein [unidentified eubacterium SCB49]|nr:long-chain fatty acid transport protein, outer membrane protein [unidentified eubacterium SCB49]
MKKILFLALFTLASAVMYAGGYRVSLQGNKSLAMGHTGVAVVNSSELVFHNPAGLVFLENKLSISAGGFGVFSNIAYENEATGTTARTDSPMSTPVYAYASYQATDWLAFGLGVYTPYGSSVSYEDDWAGSHLINNIELQAIYVQASAAIKVNKHFSFSGGFIYVTGDVNFNKNLTRSLADLEGNRSEVTIDASGVSNTGWTVSAMFNVSEKFRLGATYRSLIRLTADEATADFENIPNSPGTPFADSGASAELPMPAEMTVGLSYEFCDKWLFAFDLNTTFWSVYESLDIEFDNPLNPDSVNPRNYKNSINARFGLQYEASDKFTLRGGYYFDESPVQAGYFAPETPRNDSNNFTAGITYKVNDRFDIDASFLFVHSIEVDASYDYYVEGGVTAPFGGTYKTNGFIPGIGMTYKL